MDPPVHWSPWLSVPVHTHTHTHSVNSDIIIASSALHNRRGQTKRSRGCDTRLLPESHLSEAPGLLPRWRPLGAVHRTTCHVSGHSVQYTAKPTGVRLTSRATSPNRSPHREPVSSLQRASEVEKKRPYPNASSKREETSGYGRFPLR